MGHASLGGYDHSKSKHAHTHTHTHMRLDTTHLQEAVQCSQHDSHGQLIGVDEVQGLGHGNEDLIVDTAGYALLLHPLSHCQLILQTSIPEGYRMTSKATESPSAHPIGMHLRGAKQGSKHASGAYGPPRRQTSASTESLSVHPADSHLSSKSGDIVKTTFKSKCM
eukprot:scaffold27453_cov27-Tisochrysis_lutea.AAC.1